LNNSFIGNGVDIQDFQRVCEEDGLTAPPVDVLIISLTIVAIMILLTVTILVLRKLSKVKVIKNKRS